MLKYILKRLINMIPVMIIISIVLFIMTKIMPGDPIYAYIGEGNRMSKASIDLLREKLGFNKPLITQYFIWLKNMLTFNFGNSTIYNKPVVNVMGMFIKNSLILNFFSTVLAFAIAIPVGIKCAVKKNKLFDNMANIISLIGVSMPTFFFGLVLVYIFSIKLQVLPMSGMVTVGKKHATELERAIDIMYHMILPVVVLTFTSLASYIKYVRNAMLEVINQDYIRTARAKGLKEKVVIYKHAFRNALIPVVTLMGFSIAALFSGAAILETTFGWPGIGKVMIDAINKRDLPILLTANMFFSLMALLGNLLSDIGYALVDPRVKLE